MPPFDLSKLTPEYLSNLSEEQQAALLEELKAELARVQGHVKGQQREAIKRLSRSIARHEAQLGWFTAQSRQIDETLGKVDPAVDAAELKAAVRTLKLGQTFFRTGRKLLAIQLQDLRQDLATVGTEIVAPFEIGDPFVTYDYRRASAECDLAALQLMMIENARSHRILAGALGVPTRPAEDEEPEGGGTAMLKKPLPSRTIRSDAGPRTKQFAPSSLGLEEGLPPPEDLPPTHVVEDDESPEVVEGDDVAEHVAAGDESPKAVQADGAAEHVVPAAGSGAGTEAAIEAAAGTGTDAETGAAAGTGAEADTGAGGEAGAEAEAETDAEAAASAEPPPAPAEPALDEAEQAAADALGKAFEQDEELKRRAALIADQLKEANGLISKCLTYIGHVATLPPAEGAKLLELHIWRKLDGKVYYLRRLPDQVDDLVPLTKLFPKTEKPTLPFERPLPDAATRPISGLPTDRLGLQD